MARPPAEFFSGPNSVIATTGVQHVGNFLPVAPTEPRICPEHVIPRLVVIQWNDYENVTAINRVDARREGVRRENEKALSFPLLVGKTLLVKLGVILFE
jgi:hypothetical protein